MLVVLKMALLSRQLWLISSWNTTYLFSPYRIMHLVACHSLARIDFEKRRFLNRSPIYKHYLISPRRLAQRQPYFSKASFDQRATSLSPNTTFERESPKRGSLPPFRHSQFAFEPSKCCERSAFNNDEIDSDSLTISAF